MISHMLYKLKTPYPTSKERGEIENYIATAKARRSTLDEVRKVGGPAADRLIGRMRVAYPQFAKYHNQGFEKGHRDIVMLTNMAANAMFLGEHDTLQDQFTEWYRTIVKSVHLSPQFMKDTFTLWQEELKAALSDEAYALMRPHVEQISNHILNVPVPVRDETGERKPIPPLGQGAKSWKS